MNLPRESNEELSTVSFESDGFGNWFAILFQVGNDLADYTANTYQCFLGCRSKPAQAGELGAKPHVFAIFL
jgi:hypothetical protein